MFKSGLHPAAFIAVIEKAVPLISDVVSAIKAGTLDDATIAKIGADFVSVIVAAYHASVKA